MSNLLNLNPAFGGSNKQSQGLFTCSTADNKATVVATGYFTDKAQFLKDGDFVDVTAGVGGTVEKFRGTIVDSGTALAPILTLDVTSAITPAAQIFNVTEHTTTNVNPNVVTIAGVLATDTVIAVVKTKGASPVFVTDCEAKAGVVDVGFDALPGTDHVVSIIVTRKQ